MKRFVPNTQKSVKNDAGESQKDVLQRTSTTYDLDCHQWGMFALFFSVRMMVKLT